MKTSLVVFGIIFMVIGGLLYFVPMQEFGARTTSVEGGNSDIRTSSASIDIPPAWAFASTVIGLLLLILGIVLSHTNVVRNNSETVEINENIETGKDGKKRKVTKRKETYATHDDE